LLEAVEKFDAAPGGSAEWHGTFREESRGRLSVDLSTDSWILVDEQRVEAGFGGGNCSGQSRRSRADDDEATTHHAGPSHEPAPCCV
jgi:hypothetical protein